jgi:hypothetical protein
MISGAHHAPVVERLKAGHFNRMQARRVFNLSESDLPPRRKG